MPLPSLTEVQTTRLLAVLSLDLAKAFYADIGLAFGSKVDGFQQSLRSAFGNLRLQVERDPSHIPDVAREVVSTLRSNGHTPQADSLLRWCPQAFLGNHAKQPLLSGWCIAFNRWSHVPGSPPVPDDLKPLVEALAANHQALQRQSGAADRLEAVKSQPLSAWDLSMFARHGWAESEFSHPSGVLASLAEGHAAVQAWQKNVGSAKPEQVTALCRYADHTLAELGAWMPGPIGPLLESGAVH